MNHRLLLSLNLIAIACLSACDAPKPAPSANQKTTVRQTMTDKQADSAASAIEETKQSKAKPGDKQKVAILLNWYPEAEHGGFYAALANGIYAQYGLDVEIRPGGKSIMVAQELTLGRVQFGVANADDVLVARNRDVPMVALMAPMQNGPRCIMVRKDSGIQSFDEIKNVKLQIDETRPYVPFLKSKGFLKEGITVVPFFGSVAQLVTDKGIACQGYSFSEPFMARQQGVEVVELMMSEIGYNPYASLLVTTEGQIEKNADVCKRMVQASIEGWKKYLESPKAANDMILNKNKQGLERNALEFGVDALKPLCIPSGSTEDIIGTMTAERWSALAGTLGELKIIDAAKVSAEKAFTLKFLGQ
jgi:NitT/TauT family transport system substrate-binding protein